MSKQTVPPSRRFTARINAAEGVWVYWRCKGQAQEETSRVRDLSLGGLFVETGKPAEVGATVKLDFLVQEGQIRAEAIVRRAEPSSGMGLKFTAISNQDRSHLTGLINRLRGFAQ